MYILLRELPHEGYIVDTYASKEQTEKEYEKAKIEFNKGKDYYLGIALLKATVLQAEGTTKEDLGIK